MSQYCRGSTVHGGRQRFWLHRGYADVAVPFAALTMLMRFVQQVAEDLVGRSLQGEGRGSSFDVACRPASRAAPDHA